MSEVKKTRATYSSPRQQERHKRILSVVRNLIASVGYDNINIRDIAAESEVAIKTLYNKYGGKEELLILAVKEVYYDVGEQLKVQQAAMGIERCVAYIEEFTSFVLAMPEYTKTLTQAVLKTNNDQAVAVAILRS